MAEPDFCELARSLVPAGIPGYAVESVRRLGAGLDHAAIEVNGELVVRFATGVGAEAVEREAALLAAVARVSAVAVPAPAFTVPEEGCLAYFKLPGIPLLELPSSRRRRLATAVGSRLGELVSALRRAEVTDLVEVNDSPPALWLGEAVELYPEVGPRVPPPHRAAIEAFLATPAPEPGRDLVFTHNDLGIEHVLVDPGTGRVTGVIDWSDAAIADSAHDLGLILRDLGPAALGAAAREIGGDGALLERAWFHARCAVIEDLAYGLRTGRSEYTEKSLDALSELFSPSPCGRRSITSTRNAP